ncbi:MAG: hypothetical protein JWP27_2640, partial [Flaviaesturariibacter sp.]|nr:hypothetical protein [Flaviaesturariibacter sp.]
AIDSGGIVIYTRGMVIYTPGIALVSHNPSLCSFALFVASWFKAYVSGPCGMTV